MAILRKATDGHLFIVNGYPFEDEDGEKDSFYRTMQVGPRADPIFCALQARDGYKIEKPLYYCLRIEGDIYFNGRTDERPSPLRIPSAIRVTALDALDDPQIRPLRQTFVLPEVRCLNDAVQKWLKLRPSNIASAVHSLSLLRIALKGRHELQRIHGSPILGTMIRGY